MSVIVKDMSLPNSCGSCKFLGTDADWSCTEADWSCPAHYCCATSSREYVADDYYRGKGRASFCPLDEVTVSNEFPTMDEAIRISIRYYYERYHTGELNTRNTRLATVYANTLDGAIKKVKQVDPDYEGIADDGVEFIEDRNK